VGSKITQGPGSATQGDKSGREGADCGKVRGHQETGSHDREERLEIIKGAPDAFRRSQSRSHRTRLHGESDLQPRRYTSSVTRNREVIGYSAQGCLKTGHQGEDSCRQGDGFDLSCYRRPAPHSGRALPPRWALMSIGLKRSRKTSMTL